MIVKLTNLPIKQFSELLVSSTEFIVFIYMSSGNRKSHKI